MRFPVILLFILVALASSVAKADDPISYGHFVLSYAFESHADGVLTDLESSRPFRMTGGEVSSTGAAMFVGGANGFVAGGLRMSVLSSSETWNDVTARLITLSLLELTIGPSIPLPLYTVHPLLAARFNVELGFRLPLFIERDGFEESSSDVGVGVMFPVRFVAQLHFKPFLAHAGVGRAFSVANLLASREVAHPWTGEFGLGVTW